MSSPDSVFPRVLSQLRDSLSPVTYRALDTSRYFITGLDSGRQLVIRIPFRGVALADSSVVARVDADGRLEDGRIVRLWGTRDGRGWFHPGRMELRSLGGGLLLRSDVVNGHVVAFDPGPRVTTDKAAPIVSPIASGGSGSDGTLPDFVFVGYLPSGDEGSYVDIGGLFYSGDPLHSSTGIYMPVDPGGSGAGMSGAQSAPAMQPELDYTDNLKVVNVKNVFNCFDLVPDAGATYSIKLCVDVPVNSHPEAMFTLSPNVSPGHTFLVMTKTNGNNSVTQAFGFYPGEAISALTPTGTVASAIKDNGGHEVNMSLSMNISATQFGTAKARAIADAGNGYSLTGYNCTSYGMDVFNSVRTSPIGCDPIMVMLPGVPDATVAIQQSPQALFEVLNSMRLGNGPETGNIRMDLSGGTSAPGSHGECTE